MFFDKFAYFFQDFISSFQDLDVRNISVVSASQIRASAMLLLFVRNGTERPGGDLHWHYYTRSDSKVDVRDSRIQIFGNFNVFLFLSRVGK